KKQAEHLKGVRFWQYNRRKLANTYQSALSVGMLFSGIAAVIASVVMLVFLASRPITEKGTREFDTGTVAVILLIWGLTFVLSYGMLKYGFAQTLHDILTLPLALIPRRSEEPEKPKPEPTENGLSAVAAAENAMHRAHYSPSASGPVLKDVGL